MLNNRGVMRTFEAIIAAVIMIIGVSFILTNPGTTYSSNPSWETINAKNSAEDILVLLEKGQINDEGELGYYIRNNDITSLENKLNSLIPSSYVYKFSVSELENVVHILTTGEAVNDENTNKLTNDYDIGSLQNTKDIWHYHENGGEGNFTIFFPNGGNVTFNLLVVDMAQDKIGYDSIYLNLKSDLDFKSISVSSKILSSTIALRTGDTLSFTFKEQNITYEYTYQISNISRDGNSVSLALIGERILIDFIGTPQKEVSIFDNTFRFNLYEASRDYFDVEIKMKNPLSYNPYLSGIKVGDWIGLGAYQCKVVGISYNLPNGHIILDLVPFKKRIIKIESPGEIETTISAKRIVSVWDSGKVRDFYVSLLMGRRKL